MKIQFNKFGRFVQDNTEKIKLAVICSLSSALIFLTSLLFINPTLFVSDNISESVFYNIIFANISKISTAILGDYDGYNTYSSYADYSMRITFFLVFILVFILTSPFIFVLFRSIKIRSIKKGCILLGVILLTFLLIFFPFEAYETVSPYTFLPILNWLVLVQLFLCTYLIFKYYKSKVFVIALIIIWAFISLGMIKSVYLISKYGDSQSRDYIDMIFLKSAIDEY